MSCAAHASDYSRSLTSLPLHFTADLCSYAETAPENWPAQLQICGDPPGSSNCANTRYNASGPFLSPVSVTFDGVVYTGAELHLWALADAAGCWAPSKVEQPAVLSSCTPNR